jgi:cysteine synthase A
MLVDSVLEAVGGTPLVRLKKMSSGNVFAKAEFLNPGGSIKDRVAKHIIESAEKEGKLNPGMIIIEATSGNTGIGLSLVGIQKGYRVICVMPENMSEERKKIIQAFGGEIVFTPAEESLSGSLKTMREITQTEAEKYFIANQFANPRNPEIHYLETGTEIWQDTNGEIDIFVSGVGSGGTLQGIGDGFIPAVLDVNLIDMVFTISDEEAIETTRRLSREEGLLVGTSSGANVFAALHMDNGRNRVVTILPDRAERYFSTALL